MVMILRGSKFGVTLRPLTSIQFAASRGIWRHGARSWLAPSCRGHSDFAGQDDSKPYYITSPIFYVNAAPHVGHLYSMIIPDILKRWQLLKGRRAIFCTGTDEHGMKIQQAAQKAGIDPMTFCDKESDTFKVLAAKADIANDHFVRTTDLDHREAVQYAWQMLQEGGYIYRSKHEGWYSVSDETFYPQTGVHKIVEPPTGKTIMASIETGKEVEWTSEINYRFRLSAFRDRLLKHYNDNPAFIIPTTRMNDVIKWVSEGLEDLSISRPSERLNWGIPVPTDDSQTIYVWLDALINYITKAGYPWAPGQESARGWPADCHVIGKEIVRFHCIYWPAFLMALDLSLPRQILAHAHWTLGKQKMSKSTGNIVNPFFAIDRFGVDVMRFFLAHDGDILQDSDYDNEYIIARYKKCLQGGLGNLASRIMRGKGWNVRYAIERGSNGELEPASDLEKTQRALVQDLAAKCDKNMDKFYVRRVVRDVMNVIYQTNTFLQSAAPWQLIMNAGQDTQTTVDRTVYLCAEALRVSGILLQPYMPTKMATLLDMLGIDPSRRSFKFAEFGIDTHYGSSSLDLGRGHGKTLFPPLTSDY